MSIPLTPKLSQLRQSRYFTKLPAALAILAVAVVGITFTFNSRAATPFVSVEPEQGTTMAGATIGTDSNASGGQFVRFGGQETAPHPMAVYRGAARPDLVAEFETWFGHEIPRALDFYPGESWAALQGNDWQLGPWSDSRYEMTFSISMLPDDGISTLAAGANGDYNEYWRTMASRLVQYDLADSTLRIGWEFNGNWFAWAAENDPVAWPVYWRNIVTTMRSVPGANFKFDWNPTNGYYGRGEPAETVYPGDDYVDIIGVDVYNQSYLANYQDPLVRWNDIYNNQRGLAYWIQFTKDHGKPLSLPEWGTGTRSDGHGGGDDPYFIEQMQAVIAANNIAYHAYWDYCAADYCGRLSDGTSPNAGAKFKELFGSLFSQ